MDFDPGRQTPLLTASPVSVREGNLPLAVGFGVLAALVGAVLWAMLVSITNLKIGFAAVGIGFLVGWAVRQAGHGHTPVYGYIAACLSLLGCVAGDLLTDCVVAAQHLDRSTLDVLSHLTPSSAANLLQLGFGPLDVLFYFLAVSAGYRNAFSRGR